MSEINREMVEAIDKMTDLMRQVQEIANDRGLRSIMRFQQLVVTFSLAERDAWAAGIEPDGPMYGVVEALRETVFQSNPAIQKELDTIQEQVRDDIQNRRYGG